MATADEILATMAEEAAATDQMAEVCTIDRCTRAVTIPEALRIVGVETDKDVTRRHFKVLCSYRGTNLSTFRIRIHFMNANKEKDIYCVTDAAQDGEYLTFSWVISRNATKYKGKLQFIACMVCDGGTDEEREWNSTLGEFTVLEGLEVELTDGEEEQARDAITQLLAVIDARESEAVEAVSAQGTTQVAAVRAAGTQQEASIAAKGAATLETIPDDYTTLHNNVAALTEDLSQLKGDLTLYNAANLATDWVKADSELNGVSWTFDGDTVTATGTVNGVASLVFLNGGGGWVLPSWMKPGETYYIKYSSKNISLLIYDMSVYDTNGTMPLIFSTMQDAVFTVPDGITRCSIRLWLPSGATVQETVQLPKFLTAPSNQELSEKLESMLTKKGILPDGTDLNSVMEPGAYVLNSTHDYINSPRPKGWGGVLEVWEAHNNIILQRLTYVDANIQDVRIAVARSFEGHAWNEIGGASYNNTYVTKHYENSYTINCTPTIQANTDYLLPSTNDTTDRTGDIQTLLNTTGACHLGSGVFYVTGITIPTGGLLTGSGKGTRLVLADSVTDGYAVKIGTYGTVQDMSICGAASWNAKAADVTNDVGTRDGLIFEGLASTSGAVPYRSTVEAVMFFNLSGSAIRCENTGYDPASCLNVSDVYAFWCGCGVNIAYWSEFNRFTNVNADNCGYGCINNGGNNVFVNCAFNSNNVGILMDNSTGQSRNNSHGTFAGCSINHSGGNTGTAIKMVGMENGQIFSACQIFYGKIVIDRCAGVRFVGANIGRQVPMEITNSTVVVFSDCNMYSADASPLTKSGNTTLKFSGCYCKDGSTFNPV